MKISAQTIARHENAAPLSCDVFCQVVDNYGDIGVCWRLARQLALEYSFSVRLWVDELDAFQRLCPSLDPQQAQQTQQGVEIRRWANDDDLANVRPSNIVIEAFACPLPERFIAAMAAQNPKPVWVNLDYLSAEMWVAEYHALPSPHPRLPLTKYFFFPGFRPDTGGLLRENDLIERRQSYRVSHEQQLAFWQTLDQQAPSPDTLIVSLFAYENPAISYLLDTWAQNESPVCCLVPSTQSLPLLEQFAGQTLRVSQSVRRGALEIRTIPFLAQTEYDTLLWSCDLNFVRGEDSFVRAQWAARPMVWQIYPQDDQAHRAKLHAFLELYCAEAPAALQQIIEEMFHAWNFPERAATLTPELWLRWQNAQSALCQHAVRWAKKQSEQEDLCGRLVRFCRSKL